MRGLQSFPAACDDEISCDARTLLRRVTSHAAAPVCDGHHSDGFCHSGVLHTGAENFEGILFLDGRSMSKNVGTRNDNVLQLC